MKVKNFLFHDSKNYLNFKDFLPMIKSSMDASVEKGRPENYKKLTQKEKDSVITLERIVDALYIKNNINK
jgi:hypothetical protein